MAHLIYLKKWMKDFLTQSLVDSVKKQGEFEASKWWNQDKTVAKINVPCSLWEWGQCFVILLPCEFSLFHKKLCSSLNLWWSDTISS